MLIEHLKKIAFARQQLTKKHDVLLMVGRVNASTQYNCAKCNRRDPRNEKHCHSLRSDLAISGYLSGMRWAISAFYSTCKSLPSAGLL
jgi:hypothetical protein